MVATTSREMNTVINMNDEEQSVFVLHFVG